MDNFLNNLVFDAIDDNGRVYYFDKVELSNANGFSLTLSKNQLSSAKKIYLLPTLSRANAGDKGFYVSARNLDMTGDIYTEFLPREDTHFIYNRPIMSCYGIAKPDYTCLVRIKRTSHYFMEYKVQNGVYTLTPMIEIVDNGDVNCPNPTHFSDIKLEVIFLPAGSTFCDMARAEREYRLAIGDLITLKQKCNRPAVDYARKYPLVRIRQGWKPSPSPVPHQTPETEPPMYVACDFKRVRELADEFKRQGVAGVELQLVGWNIGGHDGRYPQIFPVEEKLGGEVELKKTIEYVKSLGYKISTHTCLIDSYEIADTFSMDDVVIDRRGNYTQIGHFGGGLSYRVCGLSQLKINRRELPKLASLGEDGLHYTDVVSIVIPEECYSKDHPLNMEQAIDCAKTIMKETSELFGGFSSEGCMDFSLKYLDYGLYTTFGAGFNELKPSVADKIVPMFECAYHGIVLYNPTSTTVNAPIKTAKDKLDAVMRFGRPSFYFYSKFRTGGEKNWMGDDDFTCDNAEDMQKFAGLVKKSADDYAFFADKQFEYFKSYDIIGNVHVASFEDGTTVVGNYGDAPITYKGVTVAPMDYEVFK